VTQVGDFSFDFVLIGIFGDNDPKRALETALRAHEQVGGLHGGLKLVADDELLVFDGRRAFEGGGDDAGFEDVPHVEAAVLAALGLHPAEGFLKDLARPGNVERIAGGGIVVADVVVLGEGDDLPTARPLISGEVVEGSQEQRAEPAALAVGAGGKIVLKDFFDDEFLQKILGKRRLHAVAAGEVQDQYRAIGMEQLLEGLFVGRMGGIAGLGDQGPARGLKFMSLRLGGNVFHDSVHLHRPDPRIGCRLVYSMICDGVIENVTVAGHERCA